MAKQARTTGTETPRVEAHGSARERKKEPRKKSASTLTVATMVAAAASAREPSHAEIAEHAYGLYLSRGAGEGEAFQDWVRAEHALRAQC